MLQLHVCGISHVNRGMLHDTEMYKNPMEFVPERHMPTPETPAEKDPHAIAFGFGRRYAESMLNAVQSVNMIIGV